LNELTPLNLAVIKGHLSVVEYLIVQKADINAKSRNGETSLHFAVLNNHLDIVECFVKYQADVHEKGNCFRFLTLVILFFT